MDICKTLQSLNAAFGPSGDESGVAAVISELARPYVDEITSDTMGNLICHKKGNGPKVMFAAHMDSLGLIVTHIEKEGFLRFGKIGGIDPQKIVYTPVRFKNGTKGTVAVSESADLGKLKIDDLYLDIGVTSEEEAKALVNVGDVAVYDTATTEAGSCIISPYQDNRISCVVLLMALEKLGASDNDLYFVFTSQEEVGLRGARTSAYAIAPDYGIAVDVTQSADIPGTKHGGSSVHGGGAAIKVMDGSVICHPQIVRKLEELAKEKEIAYQKDIIRAGGTDAGAIHQTRGGVYTGGISVPCRYIHTPTESVRRSDVEACAELVRAFAETKLEKEC